MIYYLNGGHITDPARNINEINNLRIINDIIVDADKYPVNFGDPDYPCRRVRSSLPVLLIVTRMFL